MNARPPMGPYCFNSNSQLIRTAAFLYFLLSSRSLLEISPMRSKLSPRYSNVLRHDLGHVLQFVIKLVHVLCCPRILVGLLCALDECVKFDECVRTACRREVLLRLVDGGEFLRKIGEICKGELARVGTVAYAEETQIPADHVTRRRIQHSALPRGGWRAYWYV
jgi:hypothetical protein